MNGDNAAPLYKFLKSSKGGLFGDSIKWNFSKFLVDKDGNVVDRYAPTTSPLSIEVIKFICMMPMPCMLPICLLLLAFSDNANFFVLLISAERHKEAARCMNND